MKGFKKRVFFLIRIIFLIWILVIAVSSFVPHLNIKGITLICLISSSRVEVHFIAYFIGALLCYYAFKFSGITSIFLSGFLVFLWGVVLEIVQIWIPYRNFNPADMVANALGIVAFVFIWTIFACFVRRKSSAE